MNRISQNDLEKMYGKIVETKSLSIVGFDEKPKFEIYDGFAYCPDYNGEEYVLTYPKLSFVEDSDDMQKHIKQYLNLEDETKITVLDILQTFNKLYKGGTRLVWDAEMAQFKPKECWMVSVPTA